MTVTVPVTCRPRALAPTTRTVAVSPSTSSIRPVSTIVSPGWLGAPSRMATLRRIAVGPKWSVMYLPTSPLVVRMFMKMSGEPFCRASSASWCTSW